MGLPSPRRARGRLIIPSSPCIRFPKLARVFLSLYNRGMRVSFIKMHGLGNDFVILDARRGGFRPSPEQARRIAGRRRGVGCDQLILLEAPANPAARVAMRIFNADGSRAGACGNAARCVARLERESGAPAAFMIESDAGLLAAEVGDDAIAVDMGPARLDWKEIPLARAADTLNLDIGKDQDLPPAVCVSMGNPHAVFFVEDAEKAEVARLGPLIEVHPLFPEGVNVEFVSVRDGTHLRMRVWERGTGVTQACGTGACAALVAAVRRGLARRRAEVMLDGGALMVEWLENGHVRMEGPATHSFAGALAPEMLEDAS